MPQWSIPVLMRVLVPSFFVLAMLPGYGQVDARVSPGVELYRSGDCHAAIASLDGASDPHSLKLAASCHMELHQFSRAIAVLELYQQKVPDDRQAMAMLAQSYTANGNPKQAVDLLAAALATRPDDNVLTIQLARAYEATGRLEEASKIYDKVLLRSPEDPSALIGLGRLTAVAQPDLASSFYKRAIASAPELPEPYVAYARLQLKAGKSADAAKALQKAADLDPEDFITARELAHCYLGLQQWSSVVNSLAPASLEHPEDEEATAWMAEAYSHLKESNAEQYYRDILRAAPANFLARLMLGDLLFDRNLPDEASVQYKLIAEAHEKLPLLDSDMKFRAARASFRAGNFEGAGNLLKLILVSDRKNTSARLLLAQTEAKLQHWDNATAIARELLENNEKDPVLLRILADGAIAENLDVLAGGYMEQVLTLEPTDRSLRLRLVALYSNHEAMGRLDRALELMGQYVISSPDDAEALLLLPTCIARRETLNLPASIS
jgi:tetratricopeptide (TPR) repeat protein